MHYHVYAHGHSSGKMYLKSRKTNIKTLRRKSTCCKMRVAVRREMLGAREQAWSLWNGKEVMEYTGNQIKSLIKSGQKVCGLALKENELVPDTEGFFTTNIMEHRYCGNFTPMIENENVMSNVFYIVIGSHEEKGVVYYDCISTKFEQASFEQSDVKAYIKLGIISSGARLGADDKIELASLEYEKAEAEEKKEVPEKKK